MLTTVGNQHDIGSYDVDDDDDGYDDASDDESVKNYVDEMLALLNNVETIEKCHRLAADNFSLADGVIKLLEIYKELDQNLVSTSFIAKSHFSMRTSFL